MTTAMAENSNIPFKRFEKMLLDALSHGSGEVALRVIIRRGKVQTSILSQTEPHENIDIESD